MQFFDTFEFSFCVHNLQQLNTIVVFSLVGQTKGELNLVYFVKTKYMQSSIAKQSEKPVHTKKEKTVQNI